MKIVVTGTRGIPNIMGGVETHCEELFPRIARKGFEVTVIRRKSYVRERCPATRASRYRTSKRRGKNRSKQSSTRSGPSCGPNA